MSEAWRNQYDRWKLGTGAEGPGRYSDETAESLGLLDDDGEPIDPDELEAQREAAAEDKAERQREDAMFDRDSLEDW